MQKVKFQIKGINCKSCATLIEDKLKNLEGVMEAKVDFDSQKAVVAYDEEKISENNIKRAVKEAGNYQVEDNSGVLNEKVQNRNFLPLNNNLLLPLSVIIAGLIIAGAIIFTNSNNISQKQAAQVLPNNNPTVEQPQKQNRPAKAEFKITQDDHIRGDFNAPITLVEFSDFECPFCARHFPTLNKILSDYQGKVRLVYKHFPLPFHPNAQKAAEASECAAEQGKFWEYHDKLFENFSQGYSLEKFKQWAKELGLDANRFNNCLDSGKYAQKVQKDIQEGNQKGVNGTPATFVNGQLISGALPYEAFKQIIDNLAAQ
jgi:protein-disulfide isomerase/copper chaperone CopZ